ncbi:MAG: hypothetical protein A2498_08650 [Lentisphaerae bacterium RIFOXYC12_FULL_60_16]|nr:MAG: hypothetical protein A2498_08650 [Lentisphaerae bacterium RIFOXYC12_FULL_60_16]OGV77804.1 MAG: hypothetical protein A2340_00930 [Lentisphaerae bacterium RIFOXYB12_FULL_60_10]
MTGTPTISVITPVYNCVRYIETAIQSVLAQQYPGTEHVVFDGGSTDGTLEVLKSHRHLVWETQRDHGPADATIKGLARATGDILCLLPADDVFYPGTFARVAAFFAGNPDVKWVAGYARIIDADGREIRRWITRYKNFLLRHHRFRLLLTECYLSGQAVYFHRDLIRECGTLEQGSSEYDLWLRFAARYRLGLIREYLAGFRMHPGATTSSDFRYAETIALQSARKHGAGHPWMLRIRLLNHYKIILMYTLLNKLLRT